MERRGKPFVALVSISDLEHIERVRPKNQQPLGALALIAAWQELEDSTIDELLEEIYDQRLRDSGRMVEGLA